jgi:hypothetical protein
VRYAATPVSWPSRLVSIAAPGIIAQSIFLMGMLFAQPPPCRAEVAGTLRLSWGSCDPQIRDAYLPGSKTRFFNLVASATGISRPSVASDITLLVGPAPIPDAWRFDDAGCAGSVMIEFRVVAFSKTCPLLQGTNPLAITHVGYDAVARNEHIRIANTYGDFTTTPTIRYTLWQIQFDHSFSDVVGRVEMPDSCQGGASQICIAVTNALRADTPPRLSTLRSPTRSTSR